MIAIIRVREDGTSRHLCDLDLMKFTEDQVRQRMADRGIDDDAFFICGFEDWGIDTIMSLKEAYLLKLCISELYDDDDYLVRFLLRAKWSVAQIISVRYIFHSKDEMATMRHLLQHAESSRLLEAFYAAGSWVNFVNAYQQAGYVLVTPKGIYLKSDLV